MKLKLVILTLVVASFAFVVGACTLRADDAGKNLKKAIKHYRRANELVDKGNLDKAAAEYREALRLQPDEGCWHVALGVALTRKGDGEEAEKEYELARQLAARFQDSHGKLPHGVEAGATARPGDAGSAWSVESTGHKAAAPIPLEEPEPLRTARAHNAKCQGTVLLLITVDTKGNVTDARVVKPLGLGLDENALKEVRAWKFKPTLHNGVPVAVRIAVNVNFEVH
ncbi:MAG: TonB family protein [Terriglobia bacterium]